ncbi:MULTISPECIES: Xaa-Pro peptidase family protein [unclassified Roseitalea]|uniref:M24 family metallopeptidase n=1 Tax=unclassified Roseitalea TaxID=2639107 RepID=UPI00273EA47D|nr:MULTISPECIES: Xaa-Pro peptidase family protein [unclassified Roseitalea]
MALAFDDAELAARKARLLDAMAEHRLDAMLLFAQESMYWLTGYDTFGFCFFQTMIVERDGTVTLLTRSADLRQARRTSNVETVVVWVDRGHANPARDLKNLLADRDLVGARIGIEYDTHGLTAHRGRQLDDELSTFADLHDASSVVPRLRAVKSAAERDMVRKAAELCDAAWEAGLKTIRAGADESAILAAMQGAVLEAGGDYPANEFVIGSGPDALLCRYRSGRRKLSRKDQLTLEWAGVWRHYHAAAMRTVIVGKPADRHVEMHAAARAALEAVETVMRPGHSFGDVFDAHAQALEETGMTRHRLNACGYSLGARFAPSWMDAPMFHAGNDAPIEAGMTLFAHIIIMDSETETAMTLGRTYLTTPDAPEPLCGHGLDLTVA